MLGKTGVSGSLEATGATGSTGMTGFTGVAGVNGFTGDTGRLDSRATLDPLGHREREGRPVKEEALVIQELPDLLAKLVFLELVDRLDLWAKPEPMVYPGPGGAIGEKGKTGSNGLTGATGATGASGNTGGVGAKGPDGSTGAPGPTGSTGLAGAAGPPGRVVGLDENGGEIIAVTVNLFQLNIKLSILEYSLHYNNILCSQCPNFNDIVRWCLTPSQWVGGIQTMTEKVSLKEETLLQIPVERQ